MRALVYHGPEDIRFENVADPAPPGRDGAVVRVERAGICGSDLHIYHGHGFSQEAGFIVGHEAIGEVVEVGSSVRRFQPGDRVLVAASAGCAECASCRRGRVLRCEKRQAAAYGLGPGLQGSQAQAVAVPAADTGLHLLPEGIDRAHAVLLTDNLPTGWFGARRAGVRPGDDVAVIGLGPVGLCAVGSAIAMGASRVFAIDPVPERRMQAEQMGAEPMDGKDAEAVVLERTRGFGADCAIEAVGADATIRLAIALVRSEGSVSVVGVNQNPKFEFNMALALMKSLSFHIGVCSVQAELPPLLSLVQSGRLDVSCAVSHEMGLSEGAEAYRRFSAREGGVRKILLDPSR